VVVVIHSKEDVANSGNRYSLGIGDQNPVSF